MTVNWHDDGRNFWDTHGDNFNRLKNDLMPPADRGFAALLDDLDARGLLDETLIVWAGEFGRAPRITAANAGREHWPRCYSAVLAGGGIAGRPNLRRQRPLGGPSLPTRETRSAPRTWGRRSSTPWASTRPPRSATQSAGRSRSTRGARCFRYSHDAFMASIFQSLLWSHQNFLPKKNLVFRRHLDLNHAS